MIRYREILAGALLACAPLVTAATAQPLGTFRWQLLPFCNVVTVAITQNGEVFRLEGTDDQCGNGADAASVTGTAFPNADGTIGFGLNIVTTPGGRPLHVDAEITTGAFSGTWRDSAGATGTFVFAPSAGSGGSPRPPPSSVPSTIVLNPDGGFVAGGVQGAGAIPATGPGTRMMWHPRKAAFRAGQAIGTEWDDARVCGTRLFCAGVRRERACERQCQRGARHQRRRDREWVVRVCRPVGLRAVRAGGCQPIQCARRRRRAVFTNAGATLGVRLAPNGSAWSVLSDVRAKHRFRDLDGDDVLAKIAAMPVTEWSYKVQDAAIRHIGPTAQDFHAAFGLGEDPLRIGTLDADGVALAAVRALEARSRQHRTEHDDDIATLRAEIAGLRTLVATLMASPQR